MGAGNTHYLDKCVLVIATATDAAGRVTCWQLHWLSKKGEDWKEFAAHGHTLAERRTPEEVTGTCLCLTRSWMLRLAADPETTEWASDWEPWNGHIPSQTVIDLYDHVVPIEGLHLCITNALRPTHEFGCAPSPARSNHFTSNVKKCALLADC